MAVMRTNRLTSKTTVKERRVIPATELEAQDAAFKSERDRYEAQVSRYKNTQKNDRSYTTFGGGPVDVSPAGLAEYNKSYRDYDEPEATRIERPRSFGSEAEYLKKVGKDKSVYVGHVTYKEPAKPTAQKADWSKVELNKIPTKKATVTPKAGSLKQPKSKSTATEGWFGDVNPSTAGMSNKQLKQFASYASKTNLGESFIESPKSSINEYKGEMKSQRKQFAKEGNMAGVKATTADIRQARSASKFTASKNPLDVPGMATGYRAEQDNAANRNTIKEQVGRLKKLR